MSISSGVSSRHQKEKWIWRRKLWHLSYPIILSNLFIPLPGIVDTAVLGRLGDETYLGGVAVAAVIFSFIYWGAGFLRKAATGLGAQAFGAKDSAEIWAVLFRSLILAFVISFVVLAVKDLISLSAFYLIDASQSVEQHGKTYFDIRLLGLPAAFFNLVVVGWLLGMQDARRPMILQVFVNLLNVVFDLWFVLGFGMDVDGVAYATVLAEYIGVVLGIYFLLKYTHLWPKTGISRAYVLNWPKFKKLLIINRELFIRSMLLMLAFAYQTAAAAKQGDLILAANAILGHLFHMASFGLDGFAHACETLVGKSVGAKNRRAFKAACRAGFEWGAFVSVVFAIAYIAGGEYIINLFTNQMDLRAVAGEYLIWMILMPVFGVWCFIFDGIYFGATHVVETRKAMMISVIGYLIAMQFLVPAFDFHGVMAGMAVLMILRGLTQWYYFGGLVRSIEK